MWSRSATGVSKNIADTWTHFQVSQSLSIKNWKLSATQWGSAENVRYEARIVYSSNHIASKDDFETRIDAQIGAEKLLIDWINQQMQKIQ